MLFYKYSLQNFCPIFKGNLNLSFPAFKVSKPSVSRGKKKKKKTCPKKLACGLLSGYLNFVTSHLTFLPGFPGT